MLVVFRTDASMQIGTGHVMRCLALASALQTQGATCHFICREHAGNLIDLLKARGFTTHRLTREKGDIDTAVDPGAEPELAHAHWLGASWREDSGGCKPIMAELNPNWLVVDHYALDQRWERSVLDSITGSRPQLLVIDDLADRSHVANVLLDQNAGRTAEDYKGLVPASCDLRIGPAHALLRPEFTELREQALARREALSRPEKLLITLGGIDKDNVTGVLLAALAETPAAQGLRITVVMGDSAPHLKAVRAKAAAMQIPTEVVAGVADMAQRMMRADLCIGAVGSTAWERCAMGLPTLQMVLADNQIGAAQAMAEQGVSLALPSPKAPDFVAALAAGLEHLSEASAYRAIALGAAAVTDGLGAARLVAQLERMGDTCV